jgi:hypothetical protein
MSKAEVFRAINEVLKVTNGVHRQNKNETA